MLLGTLWPSNFNGAVFGAGDRRQKKGFMTNDPLLESISESPEKALADWFFRGQYLKDAAPWIRKALRKRLTGIGQESYPRFTCKQKNKPRISDNSGDPALLEIATSILNGCPVVMAYDAPDLGCHGVLVVGYEIGDEPWLILNDPGETHATRLNWMTLRQQQHSRLELLLANDQPGLPSHLLRPDLMFALPNADELVRWRWWAKNNKARYYPLDQLCNGIKGLHCDN